MYEHKFLEKKMKIYLIFIFIILLNNQIYCLKPDDFCKKDNRKIKSCIAHNCGTKFCAFDVKTCDHLISWGILLKKWVKEPKVYKDFLSKIKNCKKNDYKNQWSHRFSFG
jgi:hypothetical protein